MTAPPAGALEACPFCGGEPVAENYVIEAQVVCRGCGARIARSHGARDDNGLPEAIAAWNRRTHGPALLAALRLREGCEARIRAWRAGGPDLIDQQHVIYDYCADDLARVLENER